MDEARTSKSLLTNSDLQATHGTRNLLLDPHSTLISKSVKVGNGNQFYPNVVIICEEGGTLNIGDDNVFYPGTFIMCGSKSMLTISNSNEFGTGGCTIKANMPSVTIKIGSQGRFTDGANIMGQTTLGDGSQVLGAITVQSCVLADGAAYTHPDPDARAPVLKGSGLARGISLQPGQVINGVGDFSKAPIEWQHDYHPKQKV